MSDELYDTRPRGLPSHTTLIFVALFLSLAVHVGMLLFMRQYPLQHIMTDVDAVKRRIAGEREKYPPLQVDRLTTDPLSPSPDAPVAITHAPEPSKTVLPDLMAEWLKTAAPVPEAELTTAENKTAAPAPAPTAQTAPPEKPPVTDSALAFSRQEVAAIMNRKVDDAKITNPRRELPEIPRVPVAPLDVTPPGPPPVAAPAIAPEHFTSAAESQNFLRAHLASIVPPAAFDDDDGKPADTPVPEPVWTHAQPVLEVKTPPTQFKALDDRLSAGFQSFSVPGDGLYFRIALKPRSPDVLPVEPRDLLFVIDCSTSMTDSRLQFCKRAIGMALESLNPHDRFNIMAFNDTVNACFTKWQRADPASVQKAHAFLNQMKATGSTDFFATLRKILDTPREADRLMVAILITDGQPTVGMTGSTEIIGEFTRQNNGNVSVFGFGTHKLANAYLLDLLTHSNRGGVKIMQTARWDIPKNFTDLTEELADPLMHNMQMHFLSASHAEAYPRQLPNLFAGRTLDIYGRCPEDAGEVVMQLRGAAGTTSYDAVFRFNLSDAEPGPNEIHDRWALLKMYELIGQYARTRDPAVFNQLRKVSAEYNVPMFYERELTP